MSEPFLGMIQYYAFNFAPKFWALCNGQLLSIQQNAALFALLGTTYGGNGVNTFALPNLQGRSAVGQGNAFTMGEILGSANVTLLTQNLPAHTHTVPNIPIPAFVDTRDGSTSGTAAGNYSGNSNAGFQYATASEANKFLGSPSVTVGNAGGSQPINIMNPYLVVNASIALQGIFPSRN